MYDVDHGCGVCVCVVCDDDGEGWVGDERWRRMEDGGGALCRLQKERSARAKGMGTPISKSG